jgi:acetyltransferase-like isoleucine patch superfamily enzyme
MNRLTRYFIVSVFPKFFALITKVIYSGSSIRFGRNFRTDNIPRIIVDNNCSLIIGDNVEFRRNVEIRVHGNSSVIIGQKSRIDRGVRILATNNSTISLKDGVRVGLYSILNGSDSITIGKHCLISGYVYIQTSMHNFKDKTTKVQNQGFSYAPIVLEDDTWLGTHVVIMPGIKIGAGGVVGSNAVVTKNVEAYQVVAGIPAKVIKERI